MNECTMLQDLNDPAGEFSCSQPVSRGGGSGNEMPDEIDLLALMQVVYRRRTMILAVLVVSVLMSLLVSLIAPRRYETAMTVFVRDLPQARSAGVTPQTLAAFAVSDRVLSRLGLGSEPTALRSFFSVKLDSASRVLTVTVSAPNPDETRRRAERWLEGFTEEVRDLIGLGPSDVTLLEVFTGPALPERPSSPRTGLNVAVAALLGAFAGIAAAFAAESMQHLRERRGTARFS